MINDQCLQPTTSECLPSNDLLLISMRKAQSFMRKQISYVCKLRVYTRRGSREIGVVFSAFSTCFDYNNTGFSIEAPCRPEQHRSACWLCIGRVEGGNSSSSPCLKSRYRKNPHVSYHLIIIARSCGSIVVGEKTKSRNSSFMA